MDGIDPEGKRPRLGSYSGPPSHSHGVPQQQPPPEPPSHTYSNHALPPPPPYNQPPPPSPYHDHVPAEQRGPPEPGPHNYGHSGYSTPARDPRQYPADPGFSRSGSFSAPPRSPNDASQLTHLRPLSIATAPEGSYYPPPYPPEHPAPSLPGYHPHDSQQLNGTAPTVLPMPGHHDPMHVPLPPGHGGSYAPSPVAAAPNHLGGSGSYGGPFMQGYNPHRKKQVRATQVWRMARVVAEAILTWPPGM
ncbi:hypothetical protein MMC16_007065 [Acarospora aff. strigata]|nr:hypothetical protein [Acarospora aff. strigata]